MLECKCLASILIDTVSQEYELRKKKEFDANCTVEILIMTLFISGRGLGRPHANSKVDRRYGSHPGMCATSQEKGT